MPYLKQKRKKKKCLILAFLSGMLEWGEGPISLDSFCSWFSVSSWVPYQSGLSTYFYFFYSTLLLLISDLPSSFHFSSLVWKNLIPFSSLRHLIQSLPSGSQLQPQLLRKPIFTHLEFLVPLPFVLVHLLCSQMGLPRIFWSVLITLFW